ncbi:hypothetical protein SAMN05444274_101647 [Mariniphaga anaerophila]|uniref:Uncharacterized protein n=1 Tax=Mariniphaga anaerophila TaxID=1484053 RepID=A0A1M4UD98_9BACT|nr:hypothetical protein [Mariniphaga anaerophila]SHE54577.1 hypothetical protein SAMN05444274_101647 [Mariniphaga anaerophila]
MFIEKEYFENWMQRLNLKLDEVVNKLDDSGEEIPLLDGEKLLDNYVVCRMLNVSKLTLQHYPEKKNHWFGLPGKTHI